jgi:hypothetical protein
MGSHFNEPMLFRIARQFEKEAGINGKKPAL